VSTVSPTCEPPPALENGDRLSRAEFEQRYRSMPDLKKAELIEGVVYVPSVVGIKRHAEPHAAIVTWLGVYMAATPGIMLGDNATVRLDLDNEPQPDALLRIDEASGGQSRIGEDDYIEGPPELIVEIATTSASYGLHDKLHAYRRNGVREYLVWLVREHQFHWYMLGEGKYQRQQPDASGVLSSRFFPELRLAVPALLQGDLQQVLSLLQQSLDSHEHRRFVQRLQLKS
jgi:Uma2 family endonuclease